MNFSKIGKEFGSFMESCWSSQKGVEMRLEKMDKLLCDVYSEVKKMNNRVDTVWDMSFYIIIAVFGSLFYCKIQINWIYQAFDSLV